MGIENAVEYEGYWWLPGQQERDVSGTLRYDPLEGITLDTIGLLVEGRSGTSGHIDVIVGISSSGKEITLIDCHEQGKIFSNAESFSMT